MSTCGQEIYGPGCGCHDYLEHYGIGKYAAESHGNPFLDSRVGGKPNDPQEGGRGKTEYRCDMLDPVAMLTIANVMHEGCKDHEPDGWRKLPVSEHINHALVHIFMYIAGSKTEDHLGRAATRLMMAIGVERGAKCSSGS